MLTQFFDFMKDCLLSIQFYKWYEILITFVSAFVAETLFSLVLKSRHRLKEERDRAKDLKREARQQDINWRTNTHQYHVGYEKARIDNGENLPKKQHIVNALKWDTDDLKIICKEEDKAADQRIEFRIWRAYHPKKAGIQRVALYLRGREDEHAEVYKEGILSFLASIIVSFLLYGVFYASFLFMASLVYTWARNGASELLSRSFSRFVYSYRQYKTFVYAIPLIMKIVSVVTGGLQKGCKAVISLLLAIILVGGSAFVTYPTGRSPIEPLILERFQSMPFPFVTKMYAPDQFWGLQHTVVEEEGEREQNGDSKPEPLPNGNTAGLTFKELIHYVSLCWSRDQNLAEIYLDAAFELYSATVASTPEANSISETLHPSDVGMMWYYKGAADNLAYEFGFGGDSFASDKSWLNAFRCYRSAYTVEFEDQYAEKALEMFWNASEGPLIQDQINEIGRFLCQMQGHYRNAIPYLEDFSIKYPNDEVIQTVRMLRRISAGSFGTAEDGAVIEKLNDTPKVNLIRSFYKLLTENPDELESMDEEQWIENSYYLYDYCPEDILNLAWIAYLHGDYGKAAKLCTEAIATNYGEDAWDSGEEYARFEIIPDAYLLIAEVFLQDEEQAEMGGKNLVEKIQNADLSFYDNDSRTRFKIDAILLANRVGMKIEAGDILSMSQQLFNGETSEDLFIQATLAFETEDYEACVTQCQEILELNSSNIHRVLFLKSDALQALANKEEDAERKAGYLKSALEAMKIIENDVEDDYVHCLRYLHAIYDQLNDDENRDFYNKKLQAFN